MLGRGVGGSGATLDRARALDTGSALDSGQRQQGRISDPRPPSEPTTGDAIAGVTGAVRNQTRYAIRRSTRSNGSGERQYYKRARSSHDADADDAAALDPASLGAISPFPWCT